MSAYKSLHPIQFQYATMDEFTGTPLHEVTAHSHEGEELGALRWSARHIEGVEVGFPFQRQGVATAMWHEGHRLASENKRVPKPRHSSDRTTSGDAWAKSVGGPLPRRKSDPDFGDL